jgi:ribosomal protein L37AE/L43A
MNQYETNRYIDKRIAWDNAVKASPHRCPKCEEGSQVQIIDTVDELGPLWKCRICRHKFHTLKPMGAEQP